MSLEAVYEAVVEGNAPETAAQVEAALAAGGPAGGILNKGHHTFLLYSVKIHEGTLAVIF